MLERARKSRLETVSDIELFGRAADAQFVGITGSNGKSTVTSLVADMARRSGVRVHAGGNLGPPALDLLAASGYTHVSVFAERQRGEIPITAARTSLTAPASVG